MMYSPEDFRHIDYLWDDSIADALDPVSSLVYRSNILGTDLRITNTGGGNTSAKVDEHDPLGGELTEVLWVKGSGGDLRTSDKGNFSSLYQDKLLSLQAIYHAAPESGVKTAIEDDMVGMYPHANFNLNSRACSIDTPLHAFIPHKHVDHMHPNAVIAVAACRNSESVTRAIWGRRPGLDTLAAARF